VTKRHQVVIVGGGPVGVALAVNLGLRGMSCALAETRTGLSRIPKGQNLMQRTLEHFYFWGLVDEQSFAPFQQIVGKELRSTGNAGTAIIWHRAILCESGGLRCANPPYGLVSGN
jgi:2-polyprenyl-6-methoxyphenol hydroxylase-like FAD-dependent oxidoreductase